MLFFVNKYILCFIVNRRNRNVHEAINIYPWVITRMHISIYYTTYLPDCSMCIPTDCLLSVHRVLGSTKCKHSEHPAGTQLIIPFSHHIHTCILLSTQWDWWCSLYSCFNKNCFCVDLKDHLKYMTLYT